MRRVLLPYDDLVEDILRPTLRRYVGVVADVMEIDSVLELILDSYFHQVPWLSPMSPRQVLCDNLRMPTDEARRVTHRIVELVGRSIQGALVVVYPGRHYKYKVITNDHICIEEYDADELAGPFSSQT